MFTRKIVLLLAILSCWSLAPHAQKSAHQGPKAAAFAEFETKTVSVPDFKKMTLAQVQAKVGVPGKPNAMFAAIVPQNSVPGGVVVNQSIPANSTVIPGHNTLYLTFQAPPPNPLVQAFNQFIGGDGFRKTDLIPVPPLYGLTKEAAIQRLQTAGLQGSFNDDNSGLVTYQLPQPPAKAKRGSTVNVTLTPVPAYVPALHGLTRLAAIQLLTQKFLVIGSVNGSSDQNATVSQQSVRAGTEVQRGDPIDVVMQAPASLAQLPPPPQSVTVPNLTSMTNSQASDTLNGLKSNGGSIGGPTKGRVTSQTHPAGSSVPIGTPIGYNLTPNQVPLPDLLHLPAATAISALNSFGLNPTPSYAPGVTANASLIVVAQSPTPPAMVDEGSTVNITLGPSSIWTHLVDTLESVPPWVWALTAASLIALSTLTVRIIKPTISIITSSSTLPALNPTLPTGPAIRFSVTLRDQIPEPHYQAPAPVITRRG
jgi:beta-lactam-binding protein with PASTA domain